MRQHRVREVKNLTPLLNGRDAQEKTVFDCINKVCDMNAKQMKQTAVHQQSFDLNQQIVEVSFVLHSFTPICFALISHISFCINKVLLNQCLFHLFCIHI